MEKFEGRTPPHNLEAERGLLGSLLLACEDAPDVFQKLKPEHFFSRRHRVLFEKISELYDRHGNADTILLGDLLERDGILDEAGGLPYVLELSESVLTSVNALHYAEIIRDRALLRRLIDTCSEVATEAYETAEDATQYIDGAEKRIFEISDEGASQEAVPIREAIKSTFDLLDKWAKGHTGLMTHYTDLDRLTNGLQPAELIVIAGRPSMGKTTFAISIAENIALGSKAPVAIFSLEVDRKQLAINLLCGTAKIPSHDLRSNSLKQRDWQRLTSAADLLSETSIFIDDSPGLTTMSIRAKARRLKAKHDIQLIIIDYLQLLEWGAGRADNRQQEISDISRSLKALARELQIPVITISQLSRAVEARESHRPRMSDLRESGAIEQDADVILLLYREEYYKPEKEEAKGKAEVIIAKQRNGPVGSVNLAFLGEFLRFENLSQYQEEF